MDSNPTPDLVTDATNQPATDATTPMKNPTPQALPTESIPTNVVETDGGWELRLALPDVRESDVDVRVESGTLTVAAKRQAFEREGVRVVRGARGAALLKREFDLPEGVGADAVEASLAHGILTVSLLRPVAEKATIPVRTA